MIKRNFGWTKKYARIEELSGLREATYREYELTPKELLKHFFFLFLPVGILYSMVKDDQKEFYTRRGVSNLNFGLTGNMINGPLAPVAGDAEEEE
jgi:hypothetical protein